MNKSEKYIGNLNIGKQSVSLDTDINYQAIEIEYMGSMSITTLLPNNYIVSKGLKKILIVKLIKDNNVITDLFTYKGLAVITKCKLIKSDLSKYNIYINKLGLEFWDRFNGEWDFNTANYEDLDFDGNNNKKKFQYKKTIYDEDTNQYVTIKEIREK
tara:strand:- start:1125 stop:1595 length:471 start_codon:yes stop_codon:yes gene_type:complete